MLNAILSEVMDTGDRQGMLDAYRSRPKQLARWLLISRKQVKEKYRATKVELNRVKVRVSDVSKSRDTWKARAESSQQELLAMKAEVERLAALIDQTPPPKKKGRITAQPDDFDSARFVDRRATDEYAADNSTGIDHPAGAADRFA